MNGEAEEDDAEEEEDEEEGNYEDNDKDDFHRRSERGETKRGRTRARGTTRSPLKVGRYQPNTSRRKTKTKTPCVLEGYSRGKTRKPNGT